MASKDVMSFGDVSRMEFSKRFKAMRDVLPEDERERIWASLVTPEEASSVESAIEGLSQEDEFALMTILMGTASHLIGLEQIPIIKGDFIVPDFLARFDKVAFSSQPSRLQSPASFNSFIEVKSTSKETFKIGGSHLRRLRNASQAFGYSLIFAVRFLSLGPHSVWVIVRDRPELASLTVSLNDFTTGVRGGLWNDHFYFLKEGVTFRLLNGPDFEESWSEHAEYGTLGKVEIADGERTLSAEGVDAPIAALLIQSFKPKQVGIKNQGSVTIRILEPTIRLTTIADAVHDANLFVSDVTFEASRILAMSDIYDQPLLVNRAMIEGTADRLVDLGILTLVPFDKFEEHILQPLQAEDKEQQDRPSVAGPK